MLTLEQQAVLETLKAFIAGEKFYINQDVNKNLLFIECAQQAVALACLQGIDESSLQDKDFKGWQSYAMYALKSNASVHCQHAYLHALMQEAKIPYVILKGSVSAYYYSDPLMRAMGDVDFLIREEDVDRASKFLTSKGFVRDGENDFHIAFKKDKIYLEMHFAPPGMPEGKAGEIIKEYISDIFDNSTLVSISGGKFIKPSDFHHGLVLLMHTYNHLLFEGVGLRHLCDWAVFVNSFKDEEFAVVFEEKLQRVGLWKFAQILSLVSCKYLGISKHEWMGEQDESLIDAVINDIFEGGNFGRKDENRHVQGMLVSEREHAGKKRNKFFQLLHNLNHFAKLRYKRMAKIPILKHFCFIPFCLRYIFRVLFRRRKKLKILGSTKQAENRKHIYTQFNLYKIGDEKADALKDKNTDC